MADGFSVDLFNAICALARKADKAETLELGCEPKHVYGVIESEGEGKGKIHRVEAYPTPRAATGGSLQPFIPFAHDNPKSEIWYNRNGITLYLDGTTRRDNLRLKLDYSDQLKFLINIHNLKLSQKDLIITLRTVLAGAASIALRPIIERLKFNVDGEGHSNIAQGSASVGKKIEEKVTGVGAIPEEVTFTVPVFSNPRFAFNGPIQCCLDVDAHTQKFSVMPLANQIEIAVSNAEMELGESIITAVNGSVKEGERLVPVYFGAP